MVAETFPSEVSSTYLYKLNFAKPTNSSKDLRGNYFFEFVVDELSGCCLLVMDFYKV